MYVLDYTQKISGPIVHSKCDDRSNCWQWQIRKCRLKRLCTVLTGWCVYDPNSSETAMPNLPILSPLFYLAFSQLWGVLALAHFKRKNNPFCDSLNDIATPPIKVWPPNSDTADAPSNADAQKRSLNGDTPR